MKRGLFAGLFAAGMAFGGSAADAEVWKDYTEWRWAPFKVESTNALHEYRSTFDLTVPVHGPWLTLPSETGMTVTWITRRACAGGLAYREKGTTNWVERWQTKYGQIDYTREVQCVHLTGLKPGTEYEYRLDSNLDQFSSPYSQLIFRGREIRSFRTADPKRTNYRVFLTSDIHGGFSLNVDPLMRAVGGETSDYYFLLGDNVEDGTYNDFRYNATRGFLDDIVRVWGQSKPTVFIRGNHDSWGMDTYKWGDYFQQPDGKTYSAFRQGPCLFVALDTMWIPKEPLQRQQWEAYLDEQAVWLEGLKKTADWKASTFRVVMFHVPIFPNEGDTFPYEHFGKALSDETPEGRVHMVIAGHQHKYARINPNTKEGRANNQYGDFPTEGKRPYPSPGFCRMKFPDRFPYVSVVLNFIEAATIDVASDKLTFKSYRWMQKEGGFYDAFELSPDGTVKDLVDVTVYPWPQPQPKPDKKGKKK